MGSSRVVPTAVLAAVALAVAAAGGGAKAGSSAPAALRVACPTRTFSLDFRPRGTSTEGRPHAKIYSRRVFYGVVFPMRVSFGAACKPARDTGKVAWDGGPARSTGKSISLRCSVPVKPQLRGAPFLGSGGTYAGHILVAALGRSPKVFLRATIRKAGSRLRFDRRYCRKR